MGVEVQCRWGSTGAARLLLCRDVPDGTFATPSAGTAAPADQAHRLALWETSISLGKIYIGKGFDVCSVLLVQVGFWRDLYLQFKSWWLKCCLMIIPIYRVICLLLFVVYCWWFVFPQDSGQVIPLIVESCIRFINLYGKFSNAVEAWCFFRKNLAHRHNCAEYFWIFELLPNCRKWALKGFTLH